MNRGTDQEKIGKFIAKLRKDKGFTQDQLAERVGVSDKAVSKWERGASLPDTMMFPILSEVLSVTITELFFGENLPQDMIAVSKKVEKKKLRMAKIKAFAITFIIVTLSFLALILSIFYVNNYDNFKIYTVSAEIDEGKFSVDGLLSLMDEKSFFVINNVKYLEDDIKIYDLEYAIINQNNDVLFRNGFIADFAYDKKTTKVKSLKEEIRKIAFVKNKDKGLEEIFDTKLANRKITLEIKYLTLDSEAVTERVSLNFDEVFTNNKLAYRSKN